MTEEYLAHSVKEAVRHKATGIMFLQLQKELYNMPRRLGAIVRWGSAQLELVARQSGQLHDLGKLDDENQAVLRNPGGEAAASPPITMWTPEPQRC